jgi:hypothetical protein
MGPFLSKRFIAFCVAVVLFTVMVFLTTYSPMELAGSISIITGIYIAGQTVRGSSTENNS